MVFLTTEMIMLLWNLAMWISDMGTLAETSNALSVVLLTMIALCQTSNTSINNQVDFWGIITAQIHLGLPCIQLFYSFVCFFWALLSYLTTRREAKSGNADSWEMHWHSCKYKPEDSTLHRHDVDCTEHQLFQKDLFWTAQAEWSRAQLRELKLCFLAEVCVKSQGFCAMVNVQ